jgi:hypothetical protein
MLISLDYYDFPLFNVHHAPSSHFILVQPLIKKQALWHTPLSMRASYGTAFGLMLGLQMNVLFGAISSERSGT